MLTGSLSIPSRRTHDASIEESSTVAPRLLLTPKLCQTNVLGDSVGCRSGALIGNSPNDEQRGDNLLAATIRQPHGAYRGESRNDTNLSFIEDLPEGLRAQTVGDR